MHECAICRHLGRTPRATMNVVGVVTELPDLLEMRMPGGADSGAEGASIAACPQHVVEIYRGRVPGVQMVWRTPATPRWRTTATASS